MEKNEMIETLMKKVSISEEEARDVLEKCDWDILDSVIYLERKHKEENNEGTAIIEVIEKRQEKEENKEHSEKYGGVGEIIGRIFKFIGRTIKKGNKNFFEARKNDQKPIRISLTISALLLIFLFVPSVALLTIGLFSGYKYSITGPNSSYNGVNNIFQGASNSADNIKKDFNEGYEK